jgi:hypothetical protein
MANLAEVVNKHLGVMVRWPELTEVSLASAVASVLGDPTFQVKLGQITIFFLKRGIFTKITKIAKIFANFC